ncbi:hypothetical protein [Rubripirellula reticaptiva]|uniref:DUF4185 domain-containing protein n=1 Tax=Rubripirellula reticaptiva TaxID=2528013 RepID=A0A5C6EMK0_9BACT|nr:hypothetical protein [Rubripirellula reticaptiva]TWU49574.1 hypothetical protein Poly59_41910 [Rubripirellula reticaptiva]
MRSSTSTAWFSVIFFALGVTQAWSEDLCRIQIVDSDNGWPVPLVELRTTHNERFVSDNAGVIAFDLPELMNVPTWFHVAGHGYSVPKDGFGYRGVRVTPQPGKSITISVDRQLPAKRLGRLTGGGLFAESQKLGEHLDWTEQGILGCDTVQNAVHNGKLYWSWGDTTVPGYPLGRFHMTGATTSLRPISSFKPPIQLRYDYVTNETSVPRDIAKLPGDGPTWLGGYASLPSRDGKDRLVATYSKIEPPLTEYERGLSVWNEDTEHFENVQVLWKRSDGELKPPPSPHGHAVFWIDDAGKRWVLFGDPFPTLKCPATFEDWKNPATWEPLHPQPSVPALGSPERITPHRGAIAWNAFRKKWVTIFTQMKGETSLLGEIWYAESGGPLGPWGNAIKVVTHQNYTFYNPTMHPEFTDLQSSILLFEATYTHTFSRTKTPTSRNDYNQVLYRLDLDQLQRDESNATNDLP